MPRRRLRVMLLWLPGRASTEHSGQYLITRGHYRLKSPRGAQQEYVQFLRVSGPHGLVAINHR